MNSMPYRILIVDDEPQIREGCRKILQAQGFEVETADSAGVAYNKIKEQPKFDAALIDLNMPGMSGLELIELIRCQDDELLLFIITAHPSIETAVEATKRGASNYIPKPFTQEELLIALNNGLEKRRLAVETKRLSQEREEQLLELAFERSKSKSILNCITDGVIVINRQKQVVLCNSAAARIITEFSALQVPAMMDDLIKSQEIKELFTEIFEAEDHDVIRSREIFLDKGYYMVNATPVYNPSRENLGVVIVLRDITALKKLNVTKAMFVSMVARELRVPLENIEDYIKKFTSRSGGASTDEDRDKALGDLLLQTMTLKKMLAELISLTDIESGRFTLKRYPIEISDILHNALKPVAEAARQRNISFNLQVQDHLQEDKILADREAMVIVFRNLLENAVNYNQPGGKVDIIVENGGIFLTVSVSDNGIGMSEEETERAFDDFYRAKNDYTINIPGTGLGLSLVKRLVDVHQGRVSVQSRPGEGSVFKVKLPKA